MSCDRNHAETAIDKNKGLAISVDGLCKSYRVYEKPEDRLKESLNSAAVRFLKREPKRYHQQFEALRDISFEIREGETIGIIGSNGSGKSTLLQLICGTLAPSKGTVQVNGRVAALLELGSGFNPEFSGRDNVFMNAALMGMTNDEVSKKFDQIVAFADIGAFIEQPVKTYSSGMMLRLAFAVVAHVDADILVIDEALSVGDAYFTQKCMRFIKQFQKRGTLLFVSHDMGAVQNLCSHSIWLDNGRIRSFGSSKKITRAYLQTTLQAIYGENHKLESASDPGPDPESDQSSTREDSPGSLVDYEVKYLFQDNLAGSDGWKSAAAELISAEFSHRGDSEEKVFQGGEPVRLTIRARAHQELQQPILGFIVKDRLGQDLFGENTLPFTASRLISVQPGEVFQAEFDFILPMLPNGEYVAMASVADGTLHDHVQHHYLHEALVISVHSSKVRWGLTGLRFDRISMDVCSG